MKANDLRIGNLVDYEQTTHVVVGMDTQFLYTKWLRSPADLYCDCYENHKPIPLTAEILEKCDGVEKKEGLIITTYSFDISKSGHDFKVLSLNIEKGNQYIYIRQGEISQEKKTI